MQKLYVLVRGDLPAGVQACQAIHAATAYASAHPLAPDHYVYLLEVRDEDELLDYVDLFCGWCSPVAALHVDFSLFWEPDIGEHTAVATVLTPSQARRLRGLRRALSREEVR